MRHDRHFPTTKIYLKIQMSFTPGIFMYTHCNFAIRMRFTPGIFMYTHYNLSISTTNTNITELTWLKVEIQYHNK